MSFHARRKSRGGFLSLRKNTFGQVSGILLITVAACWGCTNKNSDQEEPTQQTEVSTTPSRNASDASASNPDAVSSDTPEPRASILKRAEAALSAGNVQSAKNELQQLLVRDPTDYESVFLLANVHAGQGELEKGIELLDTIPRDHPQVGLNALGTLADWCMQSGKFDDAEHRYREILDKDYSLNLARRKLAYLLNRKGQRHEAVGWIQQLCLFGDVKQDELHSLISEADAMYDPPASQPSSGARPYWPIGSGGQARKLFADKNYAAAASLLHKETENLSASDIALLGRSAVEAQDDDLIREWVKLVNEEVRSYPDYWATIGLIYLRKADFAEALRCFAEALKLDPTDTRSTRRLFQTLRSLGRESDADAWIDRFGTLNEILEASNRIADGSSNPTDFEQLAANLDKVGRRLESVLWRSFSAARLSNQSALNELRAEMKQVLADKKAFADTETKWCGMDFGGTELPSLPPSLKRESNTAKSTPDLTRFPTIADTPSFRNISAAIGLDHQYFVGPKPIEQRFAIYQTFGGGVAVVDFDQDGNPDLYFAQGAAGPPKFVAALSDQLYRTEIASGEKSLVDVSRLAGIQESDYTLGVTSGDWNQDGFPDLAVTNIGTSYLLINHGDGTFERQPLNAEADFGRLSTSVAMADITRDGLPDLVVLNYLNDPKITNLPKLGDNGNVLDTLAPLSFAAARDHSYVNQGDGSFEQRLIGSEESDACTGLGVVVTDCYAESDKNEIFVVSDVRKNQLWTFDSNNVPTDLGSPMGIAYGTVGSATGAMGIAAADFDRNGAIDFHVTNFIGEPVSLYMNRGDIFEDLNIRFGLNKPSFDVLGFGCQSIDYSNDGWPDLIVTNGHVENLESKGQPFRQPAQMFANLGNRFQPVQVTGGNYWSANHLGRALATLDFNRDGLLDIVITDLLGQSVVLENETQHDNRWLQFDLRGTRSERDAIGTLIKVQSAQGKWCEWVTAGDGYLCKNESLVHFGLGQTDSINSVVVRWPSGLDQEFNDLQSNSRYMLVEGQSAAFQQRHYQDDGPK